MDGCTQTPNDIRSTFRHEISEMRRQEAQRLCDVTLATESAQKLLNPQLRTGETFFNMHRRLVAFRKKRRLVDFDDAKLFNLTEARAQAVNSVSKNVAVSDIFKAH